MDSLLIMKEAQGGLMACWLLYVCDPEQKLFAFDSFHSSLVSCRLSHLHPIAFFKSCSSPQWGIPEELSGGLQRDEESGGKQWAWTVGGNPGGMPPGGYFSFISFCPSIGPILLSQTSNRSRQIQDGMGDRTTSLQEEVLPVEPWKTERS